MKKHVMSLIFLGLLVNTMTFAIMSPKRLWHCVTTPKDCTEKEKKEARAWMIGGSVAALVAALTAFGIIRGPHIVKEAKIKAIDDEIAAIRIEKGEVPVKFNFQDQSSAFSQLDARERELRALRSQMMNQ